MLNDLVGTCGHANHNGFTDETSGVSGNITHSPLGQELEFTFNLSYPDGMMIQLRGQFGTDGSVSGVWTDNRGTLQGLPFTGNRI